MGAQKALRCVIAWLSLSSGGLGIRLPAAAQSPAGYFAGKQVKMIIGLGTGGGYDLWARMVARHIGRHLPGNPTVISQNMEGAGSFRAASYMYSQAPKDGTAMALIARDASLGPITGNAGAQFDPTKFSWLGTTTTETNVCIAYKTAPVKTVQDLLERELMVGDNGAGTGTGNYPKALNQLLGLKFKIIRGYGSSADVVLAMERGEVEGYCESLESVYSKRPDWIPNKTVNVLFQGGVRPNPELKGVPFINDLAKTEDDRQGHRIPLCRAGDRASVLRAAGPRAERLEDAARRLQRHHDGPGIRGRGQAAQAHARA